MSSSVHENGIDQVATRWNPNGVEPAFESRTSRRHSATPAFSTSSRSISPDIKRSYSPVSMLRSGITTPGSTIRNGAISPISTLRAESIIRSASPLRSEIISPNGLVSPLSPARNSSPARGVGNVAKNGNAWAQQSEITQQHQQTLAALQGQTAAPAQPSSSSRLSLPTKDKQRLSLVTQVPPPPSVPEEEEMDDVEVITMSPAVRDPAMSFQKSRSSLALALSPGFNGSAVSLSGMNLTSSANKPYFGQQLDQNDLIATGLENAFSRF